MDALLRTVHVFSNDNGMEFGKKKMRNSYHEEKPPNCEGKCLQIVK